MTWTLNCGVEGTEEGYIDLPLTLRQGDSKTIRVDLGTPVAGVVVRGSVRTDYADSVDGQDVLDFEVTTSVANQVFNCRILPVDSAAADPGDYVYDIEYEVAAEDVNRTFLGGKLTILPQVTTGV